MALNRPDRLISAQNGAIGGAVGIGAGALGNAIKVGGAKALGSHLFDGSAAKTGKGATVQFGADLPLNAGWGAAVGAAEAAAGCDIGRERRRGVRAENVHRSAGRGQGIVQPAREVLDVDERLPGQHPAAGQEPGPDPDDVGAAPAPETPKEDWTAWADETIRALNR